MNEPPQEPRHSSVSTGSAHLGAGDVSTGGDNVEGHSLTRASSLGGGAGGGGSSATGFAAGSAAASGQFLTASGVPAATALDAGFGSGQAMSGLAATLARANLNNDPQSIPMASTGSHESNGARSASSFNTGSSAARPSFVRQSFSDGVPIALGVGGGGSDSNSTSSNTLATSPDFAQQLRLASSGSHAGVPVSLPTTGPLSASDPRTQLHINNLPYRVRWQDLKDLFRRAGTVLRADVSLTPDNRSRGFGTVLMATEDDARRACDMFKGFNWQGRTLDVKIDRSGTLLGIGVGQLNPSTALLVAGAAAGRGVSPTPASLASVPYAGGASFSPALSSSPNTSVGSLAQQPQYQAAHLPAGISPALLPFLGSSSRASISSPVGHAVQPWPSSQSSGVAQQQRALSFSAGLTPPSAGTGNLSPFLANGGVQPVPFGSTAMRQPQQQHPSPHIAYASSASLPQPPVAGLPQSSTYMGRVLFVGNLPFHCQWQDLKDLFRAAGNIQRADVALTAEGKSRGFGTVLFASPEDAQNAVRIYHGYEYSGRTLKVHFDRFAQASAPPSGALPASPSQYTGAFAAANTPTPASSSMAPSQASQNMHHQQTQQQQQQQMRAQQTQARFYEAAQHALQYQQQQQPPSLFPHAAYGFGGAFQSQQQQQFSQPYSYSGSMHDAFNPLYPQHSIDIGNHPFSAGRAASGATDYRSVSNGPLDSVSQRGTSFSSLDSEPQLGGKDRDDEGDDDAAKEEPSSSEEAQAQLPSQASPSALHSKSSNGDSGGVVSGSTGGANHPGRITLPPQQPFATGQQVSYQHPSMGLPYSPTNGHMSVPMTPGMPGFTFHAVPETPPVPHHFLSPGLNGPFSPPLIASPYGGPATPGASSRAFNPMINPAPGAPIHFSNGGGATAPMANMMPIHQPNFNPMFPPIGMSYQPVSTNAGAPTSTRLPQTPHWSQPRPADDVSKATTATTTTNSPAALAAAGLGMHHVHGTASTEALARKIAQMSAQKALRQQQREPDKSSSSSSSSTAAAAVDSAANEEGRSD